MTLIRICLFYFLGQSLLCSSAYALLNLTTPRGTQVMNYANNEICVIPRKFPNIDANNQAQSNYSNNDIESELELCRMDFYAQEPTDKNTESPYAIGLCPKLHNTNPGLEIYEIPQGETKSSYEQQVCDRPSDARQGKKLAKYKISTSCSYTPSILAYYHVSRILGDILKVPPSVLRTMAIDTYKSAKDNGQQTLAKGGTIALTWQKLMAQLSQPETDKRSAYLFTTDYQQTFGGLIKNAKGEADWIEISNNAGGDQLARGREFMKKQVYKNLQKPTIEIPTTFNQENIQQIRLMGDVTDMLVMDFILSQEDRFNNIAYKIEVTGVIKDSLGQFDFKSMAVKKADDPQELQKTLNSFKEKYGVDGVAIQRIMLKDNDCGVAAENAVRRTNIVEELNMHLGIRHLKKSTYDQMQRFSLYLSNPSTAAFAKDFFMKETLMTEQDYEKFSANTKKLSDLMKKSCLAENLHLDLQLETHFNESYKPGSHNCITN